MRNAIIAFVLVISLSLTWLSWSAALPYETLDRYFWKAELPLVRHLRLTTNDAGKIVKPISFTSIYLDVDTSNGTPAVSNIVVDLESGPEVLTMFVPSGIPFKVSRSSTNRFVVSSSVTNTTIDRVIQVRSVGPNYYLATELRTQFPEESLFRLQTKENK